MAMNVQYRGELRSVEGVLYRVDILTNDPAPSTITELSFPYEDPVEIEWQWVDKLEPVQGSSLTLRVMSESDRQFVGLYTTSVGSVRCNLYREGVLYWSGVLDTELYEESYSSSSDYEVSFTFSDFSPLDRRKWAEVGVCSLESVIITCLEAIGRQSSELVKMISTSLTADPLTFGELYLNCENFFDEEGEAKTMREVLEAVLRPFALRLVQKNGRLYLYDLNAAYNTADVREVYWKGTDALLGVDKVYNNVKISFSPYAHTDIIDGSLDDEEVLQDANSYAPFKVDTNPSDIVDGFNFYVGDQDGLPLSLDNYTKFFRIKSVFSGEDEAGVVWTYRDYRNGTPLLNQPFSLTVAGNGVVSTNTIFTTRLGFIAATQGVFLNMKLTLDVLFDPRYNPFEEAGEYNEKTNYEYLKKWCNFAYIPIKLLLKDAAGNVLYHYSNSSVKNHDGFPYFEGGGWSSGEGSWGDAWLAYYDWEDRKTNTGMGGWKKNKQMLGYYRGGVPKKWQLRGDGEFLSLPPRGGYLELQVGRGLHQFGSGKESKQAVLTNTRWLMYKEPKITLVRGAAGSQVNLEDIEVNATLDNEAFEEYSIDTIVGTMGDFAVPTSRGIVLRSNYGIVQNLTRAGVTDKLENLLAATVYSQYGSRHNVLSGTVRLIPEFGLLSDASSQGVKYILGSEVQNIVLDESSISMTELTEENYQALNSD